MKNGIVLISIIFMLVVVMVGCQNKMVGYQNKEVKKPGWKTPVTTENCNLSSEDLQLKGAPDSIEGKTFEQIILDPDIAVRPDGLSCGECHDDMGKGFSVADFCKKIESFLTTDQDGAGPKPQILKNLFSEWRKNGCSD